MNGNRTTCSSRVPVGVIARYQKLQCCKETTYITNPRIAFFVDIMAVVAKAVRSNNPDYPACFSIDNSIYQVKMNRETGVGECQHLDVGSPVDVLLSIRWQ